MELRDIEYFAAIAQYGHLGKAAEALGLSQPALSKSLRRMEQALQTKLVARTAKGVALTAEGSALLAHAQPLRTTFQDMVREIAELRAGRAGHLRLAANPSPADQLLPMALGRLAAEAPEVTVTIADVPLFAPALRDGQVDIAIMSIATPAHEDIAMEYIFTDEFVVYASSAHRLAKLPYATLGELAKERWALPFLNGIAGRWMQRAFDDAGLGPLRVTLLGGPMQIRLRVISESRLLGIAPRRIVRQLAQRLKIMEIPVKEPVPRIRVGVGYRKGAYLAPAARRFIEILRSTAGELNR